METESKTVPCAGGIVFNSKGEIALVRRRPETLWFFPKGHVDEGEELEGAAAREIQEECGIADLEYIDALGSYVRPKLEKDGSPSTHIVKEIHMYLYMTDTKELTPSLEIIEAMWCPLDHVAEMLDNAKDRVWWSTVYRRVREGLQRD